MAVFHKYLFTENIYLEVVAYSWPMNYTCNPWSKEENHVIIPINSKSICQNLTPCYDKNWQ